MLFIIIIIIIEHSVPLLADLATRQLGYGTWTTTLTTPTSWSCGTASRRVGQRSPATKTSRRSTGMWVKWRTAGSWSCLQPSVSQLGTVNHRQLDQRLVVDHRRPDETLVVDHCQADRRRGRPLPTGPKTCGRPLRSWPKTCGRPLPTWPKTYGRPLPTWPKTCGRPLPTWPKTCGRRIAAPLSVSWSLGLSMAISFFHRCLARSQPFAGARRFLAGHILFECLSRRPVINQFRASGKTSLERSLWLRKNKSVFFF